MKKTTKNSLRKRILTLLRTQKEEERSVKSSRIFKKLFRLKEFKDSSTILFYASFDGEVETFDMIKQAIKLGKKIGLPSILKKAKTVIPVLVKSVGGDLKEGFYGIKQPRRTPESEIALNDIDLVVVPGVAFDKDNCRLGRGGGYYDRFLKKLPSQTFKVGLAFDFQIVGSLPHREHDVAVDRVLTN